VSAGGLGTEARAEPAELPRDRFDVDQVGVISLNQGPDFVDDPLGLPVSQTSAIVGLGR
jgi:hypothetical protein